MSDRFSFRAGDPEGVPDGDYAISVVGGNVTGLKATSGGGAGGSVSVDDEGVEVVAAASRLNFAGAGVTVSDAGSGEVTIAVGGGSGGGSGGGDGGGDWDYQTYPNSRSWQLRETRVAGTWGYTGFSGVGGGMLYNTSQAQNDAIAFSLWLAPGTYDLAVFGGQDVNRAIQTWEVDDGAGNYSLLGALDWYATGNQNDVLKKLAGITIPGTVGRRKIKATVKTRNASSTGWYQSIQQVALLRTA